MGETGSKKEKARILIVDDINVNVSILENIIQSEGHEALCALSVQEALDIMREKMPQLILSDISMPGMDGLEFCKLLKSNPRTREIPVIFITVADSREEKKAAFQAGAVDFIPKPFEPAEVIMRVNNQLNSYHIRKEMENYNRMMHRVVADQKRQMEKERENVLYALARIAQKRCPSKRDRLEKSGYNCRLLAQSLQLVSEYETLITDRFVDTIEGAYRLHDIGKIVLPDSLLLKEELTEEEKQEEIRLHVERGKEILEEIGKGIRGSRILEMALTIVKYHHANWDGSGYPQGVQREEIPLAARIAKVANDFDDLLEKRYDSHDRENSIEECISAVSDGSGILYDPKIIKVFQMLRRQLHTE